MLHGITPGNKPCLCVVKKNVTVLKALNRWIQDRLETVTMECDGQTRTFVPDIPLLVIDDEADNASVDINRDVTDSCGNLDSSHDPSAINGEIRILLRHFGKSAYVGYTATPFANIFIHNRASTDQHGDDLFPSAFIVNLSPSSNYIGPSKFFGRPVDDETTSPLNALIHHIPPTENWIADRHKRDYRLPCLPDILPESLRKAIMSFVLSCIVRKCRGDGEKHCSMLIHVTRFNDVQAQIFNVVRNYVTCLHNRLRNRLNVESTINAFRDLWENDFIPVTNSLLQSNEEGIKPSDSGIEPLPSWSEVEGMLEEMLYEIKGNIYCINGSTRDILNYEEYSGVGLRTIVIGGDKLSRGLTLEGLSVSYFMRASRMYDTLMQMGRWFGYRTGYLEVCRLYLTPQLEYWFTEITGASEELREEFNTAIATNLTPDEYGLKIFHHPALMETSLLKMQNSEVLEFSLCGKLVETVNFFREDPQLQSNLDALSNFLQNLGPSTMQNVQRKRGKNIQRWENSVLWENVPVSKVLDFLDQYQTHPAARRTQSNLCANFIRQMNQRDELQDWNVAIIGGGNTSNSPVQLTPEIQIKPVTRRAISITKNGYSIGCLPSSRDECIDLDNPTWNKALELSRDTWRREHGNAKKEPDIPYGTVIRQLRGFESLDRNASLGRRPLLMLYLVNVHNEEVAQSDLSGKIAGYCISFPNSRNSDVTVQYRVNRVYMEGLYDS